MFATSARRKPNVLKLGIVLEHDSDDCNLSSARESWTPTLDMDRSETRTSQLMKLKKITEKNGAGTHSHAPWPSDYDHLVLCI